jgi:hypothetical protein
LAPAPGSTTISNYSRLEFSTSVALHQERP